MNYNRNHQKTIKIIQIFLEKKAISVAALAMVTKSIKRKIVF